MPATSEAQSHVARMARAYQKGDLDLQEIPAGARDAVKSMAQMAPKQLEDYMYVQGQGPKKKTILGG